MMKDISKIMLNPIRMRVVQELSKKKEMTSSELCEKISDIPKTTLYRHIKILVDNNVLTVISEKKIRGSFERTLALNIGEIVKHNTKDRASENAFSFLMGIYSKLHNYFSEPGADPAKDKVFLNNTVLMMNDSEFDEFLSEIKELILKYSFDFDKGRKARDISIISSPVTNDN